MRGTAELSQVDLRHNVLGHTLRLQAHHVLELLDELLVARDLEASHQVRFTPLACQWRIVQSRLSRSMTS